LHPTSRRLRADSGSTTLEIAVLFPAVLALVLLVIQAALYWHARDAALSAAQQGLAVAKVSGLPAGETRAAEVAAALGGLGAPHADGSTGTEVAVVVTGSAPSLLPGLTFTVRESAAGPPEVFHGP
jgi:hypothetical protein